MRCLAQASLHFSYPIQVHAMMQFFKCGYYVLKAYTISYGVLPFLMVSAYMALAKSLSMINCEDNVS